MGQCLSLVCNANEELQTVLNEEREHCQQAEADIAVLKKVLADERQRMKEGGEYLTREVNQAVDRASNAEARLAARDQAWCDELENATGALIEPHHGPSIVVKHHVDVFRQRLAEVTKELEELKAKSHD